MTVVSNEKWGQNIGIRRIDINLSTTFWIYWSTEFQYILIGFSSVLLVDIELNSIQYFLSHLANSCSVNVSFMWLFLWNKQILNQNYRIFASFNNFYHLAILVSILTLMGNQLLYYEWKLRVFFRLLFPI
jgi:hypothetical protein